MSYHTRCYTSRQAHGNNKTVRETKPRRLPLWWANYRPRHRSSFGGLHTPLPRKRGAIGRSLEVIQRTSAVILSALETPRSEEMQEAEPKNWQSELTNLSAAGGSCRPLHTGTPTLKESNYEPEHQHRIPQLPSPSSRVHTNPAASMTMRSQELLESIGSRSAFALACTAFA